MRELCSGYAGRKQAIRIFDVGNIHLRGCNLMEDSAISVVAEIYLYNSSKRASPVSKAIY